MVGAVVPARVAFTPVRCCHVFFLFIYFRKGEGFEHNERTGCSPLPRRLSASPQRLLSTLYTSQAVGAGSGRRQWTPWVDERISRVNLSAHLSIERASVCDVGEVISGLVDASMTSVGEAYSTADCASTSARGRRRAVEIEALCSGVKYLDCLSLGMPYLATSWSMRRDAKACCQIHRTVRWQGGVRKQRNRHQAPRSTLRVSSVERP